MRRGVGAASIGVLVAALALAARAEADALPTKDRKVRGCTPPAGFECVGGGHPRSHIEADACTSAELKRLGLRFHCEESHNDRVTAHWCRPSGSRYPPLPEGLHEELTAGSYADAHAFGMTQSFARHRIDALRKADAEVPPTLLDEEKQRIEAREPCRRLATKYLRCGLEIEQCRKTWIRMGLVQDAGAEELAAIAAESRDASDDFDASIVVGGDASVSGATSPRPSSRCSCRVTGETRSLSGGWSLLVVVMFVGRRVIRARST